MKNSLNKIVLATMIAAAPLAAGEYDFDAHSLFAIEGGATNVNVEAPAGSYDEKEMANVGLKIGAEGEEYRIFLSARYYDMDDSSTLNTYGAEAQYLFNFSKPVNFFLGANAGVASVKIANSTISSERISEMYYGADAGFNIHASEMIDLEIGVRYMELQDAVVLSAPAVQVDSIATAYASVIIKWEMN